MDNTYAFSAENMDGVNVGQDGLCELETEEPELELRGSERAQIRSSNGMVDILENKLAVGVNLDLGVENDGFTVSGKDVDPLPVGVVPTNQQVAAEDTRRRKLVKMVPNMNGLDAAERELRNHEVLNRANPMPPLHPALLLMLQNIQDNIQDINLRMETLLRVMSARTRNQRIKEEEMDELYRPLPKLLVGHPYAAVLPVQGVNIVVGVYQVGDLPPDGLVPTNNNGYIEATHLDLPELRRKLRAIYWFYHDDSLFIPHNASLQMCCQGLVALKRFHLP